jgi:purine-nucleoside phosphorylase
MSLLNHIEAATAHIQSHISELPTIGLILGSGLGPLADQITDPVFLPYSEIPHFPISTVAGHAGRLVIGKLGGKQVLAMQGRFHYYEGYTMQQVTFPVRVMKALGIETMIVTNACGGFNPAFEPGTLMFIRDHINFTGDNPLMGKNHDELGTRFPDMSNAYAPHLIALGQKVAQELGIETHTGIYTCVSGPYYCSKAELAMIRSFGSDTIGMSTVPETIVAVHSGMQVLGISCVTDMAIPETLEPLEHSHVVEVANRTRPRFINLVTGIVEAL